MRRMTLIVAMLLGSACDLSDEFEGEPCDVAKDCSNKQECARTPSEEQLDLPGICAEEGTGCTPGGQLGCVCDPEDSSMDCSYPVVPIGEAYPLMTCEPIQRVCVVAPVEDGTEG